MSWKGLLYEGSPANCSPLLFSKAFASSMLWMVRGSQKLCFECCPKSASPQATCCVQPVVIARALETLEENDRSNNIPPSSTLVTVLGESQIRCHWGSQGSAAGIC